MTEPTFTEAEIREALLNVSNILLAEKVIAHLQHPKHDFAEGQLLIRTDKAHEYSYYFDRLSTANLRGLTLTELGPHVKALRDAMVSISRQVHSSGSILGKIARSAIKAFDAAVGENNDSRN